MAGKHRRRGKRAHPLTERCAGRIKRLEQDGRARGGFLFNYYVCWRGMGIRGRTAFCFWARCLVGCMFGGGVPFLPPG
eukprot:scaffold7396_cov73-Isochrysis_galbana.AAC.1